MLIRKKQYGSMLGQKWEKSNFALWTESLCPSKIHTVEILSPNVMVLGGGASGRWLGLGEAMRVEPPWWDSCPYKSLPLSDLCHMRLQWEVRGLPFGRGPSPGPNQAGILDFLPPNWEKSISVFYDSPTLWHSTLAVQTNEDTSLRACSGIQSFQCFTTFHD